MPHAPRFALVARTIVDQPEAMSRIDREVLVQELGHPGVVGSHGSVAQSGSGDPADSTGLALAQALVVNQRLNDLRDAPTPLFNLWIVEVVNTLPDVAIEVRNIFESN